jgi:hypothetical protein
VNVSHFPDLCKARVSRETVVGEVRVRWARDRAKRLRMRTMVKVG